MSNPDVMWPRIHSARQALAQDLSALTEAQWGTRSLCAKWTVQNVLAHLISGMQTTRKDAVVGIVKHGFSIDKTMDAGVSAYTHAPGAVVLERYREASKAENVLVSIEATLAETMIHAEDIRRPLGIHHRYPDEDQMTLAAYLAKGGAGLPSKKLGKEYRFVATDQPWSFGKGLEVKGPLMSLLMVLAGRPAFLEDLEGTGLESLRSSLDEKA